MVVLESMHNIWYHNILNSQKGKYLTSLINHPVSVIVMDTQEATTYVERIKPDIRYHRNEDLNCQNYGLNLPFREKLHWKIFREEY